LKKKIIKILYYTIALLTELHMCIWFFIVRKLMADFNISITVNLYPKLHV
jgi:hypothetical protein